MSTELSTEMAKVLNREVVTRHSYFQMKYFIVGKEPTQQSKMWRCIRELQARSQSLKAMTLELDDMRDNLALQELKMRRIDRNDVVDEIDKEEQVIIRRKEERKSKGLEISIKEMEERIKETQEEATFFLQAFQSLEEQEELKPYDDAESQSAYWNNKLTEELNLRMLVGQPVTFELVKSIMSLDNQSPIKREMIHILEEKQKVAADKRPQLEE